MPALAADSLHQDPRIAQAKSLLLEALEEHQSTLTGPRPPSPDKIQAYQALLDDYATIRPGALYYPYIGSGLGKGCLVELADGSVKYDFINGIGVYGMGHHHPALVSACIDSALDDLVIQGHLQQNKESYLLTKRLIQVSGLDRCILSTSGAIANENAWKIIFQKHTPAHRILAFDRCFLGRTLGMAQVTDKPDGRVGLPPTLVVDYLPTYDPNDPEGSTTRCINRLQQYISRYPGQHAGLTLELIQGEGGFHSAPREFYIKVFEQIKAHNIAIHVDEVQTFGRTTQLFAYQHFQLQDYIDVVSIGKLSHVCATLYRNTYHPQPGLLSQTFTSSSSLIRSSLCILDELISGNYYGPDGKNARYNAYFCEKFDAINAKGPGTLFGPYGVGAMIAFTPWNGDAPRTQALAQELFQQGLISFPCGSKPTRIRFLLPIAALTFDDIDGAMDILEHVVLQKHSAQAASK